MTNYKNVPALRFKGFENKWEMKKLGEVFSIFNGYAFSSKVAQYGGVKWVKIADVGIQKMKQDNISYLPQEYLNLKKYQKFILKQGDFVIALTRPILKGKLKIAEIDTFFSYSLLNQRVGKLISPNNYNFVYFLLQRQYIISSIENNIAGTDPPNLSPKSIKTIKTYIPTVPEQQKIANFLTATDTKIQQLRQKKGLLNDYKKGVMQQIFKQEIRFKNDDGGDFEDWEVKKLKDVLTYEQPTKYIVSSTEYKNNYKTPVLTAGKTFILGYTDEVNNIFKHHPVIIFDDFTTAYKYVDFDFKVKSSAMKILKPIEKGINLKYIYEAFQAIKFPLGEHKRYWISEYSYMKIPFPCEAEQQKIANFLSSIDERIGKVSEEIGEMERYKKGLLQGMFV
jgi:type I restriction enzyme S subunit